MTCIMHSILCHNMIFMNV